MHVPIRRPDLVSLSDFDILRLFIVLALVNGVLVDNLVRIFDVEQVQSHSLIRKLVYQR